MNIQDHINKERDSIQAKELQKFLKKVKAVLFIPKENDGPDKEFALLSFVLDTETYVRFKDYGINKTIVNLLDNKFPILSINVEETSSLVGLSIVDKDSGLRFSLPDQPLSEPMLKFLENTNHDDKIPVVLGFVESDHLVFDKNIKSNFLIILDGYIFE